MYQCKVDPALQHLKGLFILGNALLWVHLHTASVANKVYLPYLWIPDNLCTPRRTSTITIMAEGRIERETIVYRWRYTTNLIGLRALSH